MRHVSSVLLLCAAMSAAGCATTHLKGEYNPDSQVPLNKAHQIEGGRGGVHSLAKGHDWVLFWGIVELQKTDMAEKLKGKLRPDEMVKNVEVRNHISLPGALLWIVTAGLVSHHDVDFRGEIVTLKELPTATTAPREGAPGSVTNVYTGERGDTGRGPSERDLFAESTIDRPIGDVEGDFNDAARRAGLIPIANVKWDDLSPADRGEYRGEIPENRLADVATSKIESFCVTNDAQVKNVKSNPRKATHLPCIVCYEQDGKTRCLYGRPTIKLRELERRGYVGDGKMMSRDDYDKHFELAQDFERSCQKLIDNLKSESKTP